MRVDDLFEQRRIGERNRIPQQEAILKVALVESLRLAPSPEFEDVDAAVCLARLVHDEVEHHGTDGVQELDEAGIRECIRALKAILTRLGITSFSLPFRDFSSWKAYWLQQGASGSWATRRVIVHSLFEDLHETLEQRQNQAYLASLANGISPLGQTGWGQVDAEIAELRRHFSAAQTAQDYRNVGNDCVTITESLSRQLYHPDIHLRKGEAEPPVAETKNRLDRFVEVAAAGGNQARLRKLVKSAIELAQEVKHRQTPSRRDAGIAADTVVLLANILRRLDSD